VLSNFLNITLVFGCPRALWAKICACTIAIVIAIVISGTLSLASIGSLLAASPVATDIRIGSHANKTRFVIDISEDVKFKVFTLSDPYRVVIDLPALGWRLPGKVKRKSNRKIGLINRYRYGLFSPGLSRVVLDVNSPVKIKAAFVLPPAEGKRYRLVLDLGITTPKKYLASLRPTQKGAGINTKAGLPLNGILPPGRKPLRNGSGNPVKTAVRKPVIVIDPGHGGIDPGSTSGRVFEKHITLAIAKRIKAHLDSLGRYTVRLTRQKDSFIRLRKRIAIARAYKADLFISLHADAIKNKRIRGLSVYTLSEKASDKEAAELADKENKADLIAGMDFSTKSKEVTNILIDLAQRETMNESSKFAAALVKHIRIFTKTLSNAHRFAGFAVLKAPDVPSILIEMGFLSNRADERALLNSKFRTNLAHSIGKAVDDYFSRNQQVHR
jgi:N-acetylmuramoyl-L-alanine amidase